MPFPCTNQASSKNRSAVVGVGVNAPRKVTDKVTNNLKFLT